MEMEIVFSGKMKVDALLGNFVIKTDQLSSQGGDASAPQPFDLFLASLGTCTALYVLIFCNTRHIPTEDITLHFKTERDKETHLITNIDMSIKVPKTFPEKYHQAMVMAAGKCAVKRLLEHPPGITIRVEQST
jgi:putative redox protein